MAGLFGNDKNPLWRFGEKVKESTPYKISIRSLKTGKIVSAITSTLRPALINGPFKNSNTKFSLINEYIIIEFLPRENSYAYDVKMEVVYDEFSKTDTANKTTKTAVWNVLTNNFVTPFELKRAQIPRLAFLQFIGGTMNKDSALLHRLKYVNMVYYGGNQTLTDYISVNQPSIGIVQKTAEYTNIEGGFGIFGSRCIQSIKNVKFDPAAIIYIQNHAETRALNVVK